MLENVDLTKKMPREEFQRKMPELKACLAGLQRQCREQNIPVMIVFEGYGASGKGLQIGQLIQSLDPRGFRVFTIKEETEEERMHPFLWRFWRKLPAYGQIRIYDGSWYRKVLIDRFEKRTKEAELPRWYQSINTFEKQLTDDGTLIVKIFLDISKKEQKRRFQELMKREETAWRVTKGDWKRNKNFERYQNCVEEMLRQTNTEYAPWNLIEATDKRYAAVKIYTAVIESMKKQLARYKHPGEEKSQFVSMQEEKQKSMLSEVDLSLNCSKEAYKRQLKKLQTRLEALHGELYRRKIPMIIGFEGWDAGGKGGAIKRLTEKMDPRGYVVNPTAAPNDIEKAHHYLWRFWKDMPKNGHIAVFDRTWYGRVMVERIEGFCTTPEWQRAYREINDMEKELADAGAIFVKFWMQIDQEEQKRRFEARQENPEKQWKITEEDWRNREKWEQYEIAVNEMLNRTSTTYAPWIIVEGNDKYYARIKVLQTVVNTIEKRLKEKECKKDLKK